MRNTRYNSIFLTFLLLLTSAFRAAVADTSSLQIEGAWISEPPPSSKVLVAYMDITNTGSENITINKVGSDMFSSIEMHETVHEDGMARMVRHESMSIPAGTGIQLKRGGRHLMLFNPVKRLKAGDEVRITLNTDKGATIDITIPVKKAKY